MPSVHSAAVFMRMNQVLQARGRALGCVRSGGLSWGVCAALHPQAAAACAALNARAALMQRAVRVPPPRAPGTRAPAPAVRHSLVTVCLPEEHDKGDQEEGQHQVCDEDREPELAHRQREDARRLGDAERAGCPVRHV